MRVLGVVFAVVFALAVHAAILAFGGWFFLKDESKAATIQEIDLLTEDDTETKKDEPKPEEKPEEPQEQIEAEEPPDAAELIRSLEEQQPSNGAPELEAASLSQLEAALSGRAMPGGDFGSSVSFASGGVIGGTGKPGAKTNESIESAFNLSEIDQKPRAVFQSAPIYPAELRSKKLEGVVTVIFIVDPSGKVTNPRTEKSTHPAFEKPALDAVRKWKFEPAVRGGERVACKMRVPIRFQPR